jgi:hypothetical protein
MLAVAHPDTPLATFTEVAEPAKTCIDAAKAPATLKAYRSDWNDFTTWCWKHQRTALPANPQTVVRQRAEPYLHQ